MIDDLKLDPEFVDISITDFNTKTYATITPEGVIHINLEGKMVNLQSIIDSMTELRDFMRENLTPRGLKGSTKNE